MVPLETSYFFNSYLRIFGWTLAEIKKKQTQETKQTSDFELSWFTKHQEMKTRELTRDDSGKKNLQSHCLTFNLSCFLMFLFSQDQLRVTWVPEFFFIFCFLKINSTWIRSKSAPMIFNEQTGPNNKNTKSTHPKHMQFYSIQSVG